MADFWSNFASGMANSPQLKGSVLGSLIGAAPGVANRISANRSNSQAQKNPLPTASPSAVNAPSLVQPSQPMSDPTIGGDMIRPSFVGPGNRSQMVDLGPAPTKPGFRMPSAIWGGMSGIES